MKQGEAVFQAVSKTFQFNGEGVPETGKWTEAQRNEVYATMLTMFKTGQWAKTSGGTDEASVMKYIPGLVNNWVRKDKRLNGGTTYETKRPGSRTGSGDEVIKNMRVLLSVTDDPKIKDQIQAEIDKRLAELKPKPQVDFSLLPEELRHLIPG